MKKKAVSGGRRAYILTMRILMGAAAIITAALVLFLIAYVLIKGLPNVSWTLLSTAPSYLSDRIGILPDILNTLYIVIATLLIVLPLGVGAAVYLTEYAQNKKLVAAIDGLRALAVLAVVVFHTNATWLPGGFTGVDLVFVVSGLSVHAKSSGMVSPWPVKNSRRVASTGSSCSRSIQVFFTFAVLSEKASEVCVCKFLVDSDARTVAKKDGAPVALTDVRPGVDVDSVHGFHSPIFTGCIGSQSRNNCDRISPDDAVRSTVANRMLCPWMTTVSSTASPTEG